MKASRKLMWINIQTLITCLNTAKYGWMIENSKYLFRIMVEYNNFSIWIMINYLVSSLRLFSSNSILETA